MFTGIIEEVGSIRRIDQSGENRRIVIEAKNVTRQLHSGDSCAVSGVCLTALDITPTSFAADLAPETWVRTSFSRIHPGARVNLELPLAVQGRLGGHIVQGHVDGIGRLEAFERIAGSDGFWLHIQVTAELEKYLVFKGSIAIEGISLTIAKLDGLRCSVAIIPHTVECTNLGTLKPRDPVNVETDILAKYLEKWTARDRQSRLSSEALVAKGF
jgi:riboflavin synthase